MKKSLFVIGIAFLSLLVSLPGCAKRDPVQQYFSSQKYSYPVDYVKLKAMESAAESDSGNYLSSGNEFVEKHSDLAFWKKLMPQAEAFLIYAPYVVSTGDSTVYEYAVNVSAFGTGAIPSSNAIFVQGGEVWRWDNIAQFKQDDTTWVFSGWLN